MNDTGDLQQSLAAMGLVEMALALFCLICYCLVLNAAVAPKVRRVAGPLAIGAATLLVVATEPWTNGVILVAIGVAAIGAFVVAAWAVSAACDLAARRESPPGSVFADESPTSALAPLSTAGRPASMSAGSRLKTRR